MTAKENTLNQGLLKENLSYDLETGVFTRRISNTNFVKVGSVAGWVRRDGYIEIKVNGRPYLAHRLAWLYMTGSWPADEIDHIDGNPGNNRFHNLRSVDHKENGRNQKMPCNNTSGIVGIHWFKPRQKWQARITLDGKRIYLGYFDSLEEATKVRKQAEIKYDFHENHGRE